MEGVKQIAKWNEADGYELTTSHTALYEERPDAAFRLEKCMIRALQYFRAHPYRRIDQVAQVIGWTKSYVAMLCDKGIFPAVKRLDVCTDGQQRNWWFVNIYRAVEFRSLPPPERRKIMKQIRAEEKGINE